MSPFPLAVLLLLFTIGMFLLLSTGAYILLEDGWMDDYGVGVSTRH